MFLNVVLYILCVFIGLFMFLLCFNVVSLYSGLGQTSPATMQVNMCLVFVFAWKTRIKIVVLLEFRFLFEFVEQKQNPDTYLHAFLLGLFGPWLCQAYPPLKKKHRSQLFFPTKLALEENFSTNPVFIHTFCFVLGNVVFQTQGCDWQCSFLAGLVRPRPGSNPPSHKEHY